MNDANETPEHPKKLNRSVRLRRLRRERWEREGEPSILQYIGLIGTIGSLIVLPTLAGIFLGRWLDRTFDTDIFWTVTLLVAGLALGCYLAWKRVFRE